MKVAFSRVNITPKDFLGKALAGYTRKDPCLGKLDDIYVFGVLIEEIENLGGMDNILFLSFDLLKIPLSISNYIKNRIQKAFPTINKDNIIIHATHTHAAFDLTGEFYWPGGIFNVMKGIMFGANRNDKYIIQIANHVITLVSVLVDNLVSCKIAWKKQKFNPDIVINRRHPSRKLNSDLGVIAFKNIENNELIGFITHYSCHPTTLSFKNNKLSADFPGRIIHRIDEISQKKFKSIYFNGPSGDLNPITTCGTNYEELEADKTPIYDQLGTYVHTQQLGRIIADEATRISLSIRDDDYRDTLEISQKTRECLIPMKDHKYFSNIWLKNKIYYAIKKWFLMKVAKNIMFNANFPIFILKKKGLKLYCKTLIQYFTLTSTSNQQPESFSIITIPGELFEDIGKSIIKHSPTGENNTFIFQNSQDWIAYLFPLKEYVEEGGYEPIPSFSPLCGDIIEKEIIDLLNSISIDQE